MYALVILLALLESLQDWTTLIEGCALGGAGLALIFAVITLRISKRFSGFVRLAENIFHVFGWQNVKSIDFA